ncbi:MAG TPA: gamma carbonic anhydrase family protein [Pseudonocardiaceae bacterium]|jgi:carbonic anhydrase/acetyltransferase-like protein (isoleucine patch superfamily)|nr:gamma carbonic anhydrase family protein [Pseudonocardiaceae bacterium]
MPLFAFEGSSPTVHPTAWIAPTATLVGDVTVEANASVWYGVVLRADFGPVIIREGANIQDNSVLHGGPEGTEVGPGATVGHLCVVHGATIGAQALIGNGATIQDGVSVGPRTLVAAGATVAPNTRIDGELVVLGQPAREQRPLSTGARGWVDTNPAAYQELARRHQASVVPVEVSHGQV